MTVIDDNMHQETNLSLFKIISRTAIIKDYKILTHFKNSFVCLLIDITCRIIVLSSVFLFSSVSHGRLPWETQGQSKCDSGGEAQVGSMRVTQPTRHQPGMGFQGHFVV